MGSNHKDQYGVDNDCFEQNWHFYGDWLSLNAIKSAAKRYKKKHAEPTAEVTPQPMSDSSSPGKSNQPPTLVDPSESSASASMTEEAPITSDEVADQIIVSADATPPNQTPAVTNAEFAPTVNLGVRSKDSTNAAKKDLKRRKQLAKDRMAQKLKDTRDSKEPGKDIKAGLFNQIMADTIEEFGVDVESFNVSKQTISQRVMRNSLVVTKPGQKASMEYAERIILAFAIMKQEAGQPIKVGEVLELGNSLIKKSVTRDHVIQFQKSINNPHTGILYYEWVRGFFSRH